MPNGYITRVEYRQHGSSLAAAADAGDTVLHVEWTGDFSLPDPDTSGGAAVGRLLVDDQPYDYTAVDDDADTLTLTTPLTEAADLDTPIRVVSAGVVVADQLAHVTLADGTGNITVTVPPELDIRLAPGVEPYADATWEAVVSPDLTRLVTIPDVAPAVQPDRLGDGELRSLLRLVGGITTRPDDASPGIDLNSLTDRLALLLFTAHADEVEPGKVEVRDGEDGGRDLGFTTIRSPKLATSGGKLVARLDLRGYDDGDSRADLDATEIRLNGTVEIGGAGTPVFTVLHSSGGGGLTEDGFLTYTSDADGEIEIDTGQPFAVDHVTWGQKSSPARRLIFLDADASGHFTLSLRKTSDNSPAANESISLCWTALILP